MTDQAWPDPWRCAGLLVIANALANPGATPETHRFVGVNHRHRIATADRIG